MVAYSFDRFRRDLRRIGQPSWPVRFRAWLAGTPNPLKEIHPFAQEIVRIADALGAELTSAERANPRNVTPPRQSELARAAGLSTDEVAAILFAYLKFEETVPLRAEAWWQEMAIHAIFLVGLPLLVLTASIVLVAIGLKLAFG